jgi:hypothetical protein
VHGLLRREYEEKRLDSLSNSESESLDNESLGYDETLRKSGHFLELPNFYQIVWSCLQLRILVSLVTRTIPSASAVAPIRRSHGSAE